MDNKLSELSKPVAYDYQIAGACIADGHNENGKWVDWNNKLSRYCPPDWMVEEGKVTELKPLYSQEYISALTQRIAELESANQSQDDHINQQQDRIESLEKTNTGLGQRLGAAEKRLATPVRLHRGALMVSAYAANSFNSEWHLCLARDSVVSAIRAAGFTVEGDEQ
ncbi:hypothetical protein [Serratia nevei]|uniref:hypothetical protein n=1 Tax=Serratia nevei TaxID=2703794 RepID=UPI00313E6619